MSIPPFFHADSVRALIRRASRLAAAPVSIHYYVDGEEAPRISGCGGCKACRWVATVPKGRESCRESRRIPAERARGRSVPVPFVCHMGFACVCVRALPDEGYVITMGPYCPSDTPEAIESVVLRGAVELKLDPDEAPPDWVSDIPRVPPATVHETAVWLAVELEREFAVWMREHGTALDLDVAPASDDDPTAPAEPAKRSRASRATSARPPGEPASAAAALLEGGNPDDLRRIVEAALAGPLNAAQRRPTLPLLRASALGFVGEVLAAAEAAGRDTTDAFAQISDFTAKLLAAQSSGDLRRVVLLYLSALRRTAPREADTDDALARLNAYIEARLPDPVSLADAARILGCRPTALTHRLQRRFGLSFTAFVGRIRVERAKALLRDTTLTVAEIAVRVGVDDAANLSRLFRRHEGVAPGEYRARARPTPRK